MEKLNRHSHSWYKIGQCLGFTPDELENIKATPLLLFDAPSSYLNKLISMWVQWAPGDTRGSRDYATMASLCGALDNAGFGVTAQELRNSYSAIV